jgi:diguanylate cyclase (GGDEF)-like protein
MADQLRGDVAGKAAFRVVWGPQRFRLSIGWKTLIAFLIAVFVPLAGITYLTEAALASFTRQHHVSAMTAGLRGALKAHADRLGAVAAVLSYSASNPAVKEAVAEKKRAPLAETLQQHAINLSFVDAWLVIDPKGNVVSRRNGSGGDQVALSGLLSQAANNGFPVTGMEILPRDIFLRENNERYLRLERLVLSHVVLVPVVRDGAVIGALVGVILLDGYDWLPNILHDNDAQDIHMFAALVQESRIVAVTRRPNNIWSEGQLLSAEVNDPLAKGRPFGGTVTINGAEHLLVAEPLLNAQRQAIGSFMVGSRASTIDNQVRSVMGKLYGFILLGGVLALIITLFARRDTVRPIRALVGAMDEFATGNAAVRTEILTKDEFEDLGRGFNRMADAIMAQQEKMENYNSLAKLLITTLNPKGLLKSALEKVIELTNSDLGVVYLMGDGGDILKPFVAHGIDCDALADLSLSDGAAGFAAAERRTVRLKDIPPECYVQTNLGFGRALPREVAAFPITYKEKVLGVMLLATLGNYQEDELPLVEYLTSQIGITLDNALTHEKVERLSVTDGLTGLFNRRHFSERIEEEFSKASRYQTPLSVLIMDVDHFKRVNDTYGHQVGDIVLIAVAQILRQSVRETDLIGRYGGEEFVVLLPHTEMEQAVAVAEKIRKAVSEKLIGEMDGKAVTISIGVAGMDGVEARNVDDLIRHADGALYRAKEEGRNRVVAAGAKVV